MNKHLIIGRLGKDPEVVSTTSGKRVARFTMATSESYKDKATGEKKEITDWHNCVLWGPAVDALEKYVKKGHLLHVEGRVSTRKWEKDGVTHWTTETIVTNFEFLQSKGGSQAPAPTDEDQHKDGESATSSSATDGLPF